MREPAVSRKRGPRTRRRSTPPEARAPAGATAAPQDVPEVRRGPFLTGIVLAVLAVWFAPASLRDLCIVANHGDFVPDELELEYVGDETMAGRIASTGERFST